MRGISKIIRIGSIFDRALDDFKKKMEKEWEKKNGYQKRFTTKDAAEGIGIKYFRRNFGTININDIAFSIEKQRRRRR